VAISLRVVFHNNTVVNIRFYSQQLPCLEERTVYRRKTCPGSGVFPTTLLTI
jgi:hypothetical protein